MDLLKRPQCDKIYELLIPRKQEPVKKPNFWNQSKGFLLFACVFIQQR